MDTLTCFNGQWVFDGYVVVFFMIHGCLMNILACFDSQWIFDEYIDMFQWSMGVWWILICFNDQWIFNVYIDLFRWSVDVWWIYWYVLMVNGCLMDILICFNDQWMLDGYIDIFHGQWMFDEYIDMFWWSMNVWWIYWYVSMVNGCLMDTVYCHVSMVNGCLMEILVCFNGQWMFDGYIDMFSWSIDVFWLYWYVQWLMGVWWIYWHVSMVNGCLMDILICSHDQWMFDGDVGMF